MTYEADQAAKLARFKDALESLIGQTIVSVTLTLVDDDGNLNGDHDLLTVVTANGTTVTVKSQDSEGYQSWLELVDPTQGDPTP
jgi:hypothetical protein